MHSVQIFSSESFIELEKNIANWLKSDINIEILKVSQSVIKRRSKHSLYSISLKYKRHKLPKFKVCHLSISMNSL